ncbi:isoleucine--tRNA ligase, chloroplastic/mitochondrial-like protein [Tanacetum coccineum]
MASFKINRTINIFTVCLQRFGVWADWDHPYLTLDPEYEAAHIKVFGQMVFKGFIYRDRKPVHWSPSSRNALAEAELEVSDFVVAHMSSKGIDLHTKECHHVIKYVDGSFSLKTNKGTTDGFSHVMFGTGHKPNTKTDLPVFVALRRDDWGDSQRNKLMFCKRCDGAYHCYCQHPPHNVKRGSYGFECQRTFVPEKSQDVTSEFTRTIAGSGSSLRPSPRRNLNNLQERNDSFTILLVFSPVLRGVNVESAPRTWSSPEEAGAAVAAELLTGTWTNCSLPIRIFEEGSVLTCLLPLLWTTVVNDSSLKKEVETFAEMPSRSHCVAILEDAILITAASSLGRNSPHSLVLNNAKNTTPLNSQSPVTINSGGVVFFALFNAKESGEFLPKEEAAVIKIASSRMATQSERLSCEFAKWLGVRNNLALVGKTQGYGKPVDRVVGNHVYLYVYKQKLKRIR